jgi:hypothetical protein
MPAAMSAVRAWPTLGLAIVDWPDLAHHFELEYGPATDGDALGGVDGSRSALVVERLRSRGTAASAGLVSAGRHKTTSWSFSLGEASSEPIRGALAVRGTFGKSLVQSLIVEPLLTIAMARHGRALLPAAGIVLDGGTLLLAGASRSGKSSLAVRAWARGERLLGDDRIIVTGDGWALPFPRRLRLYPDLRSTAHAAFRQVGFGVQARLRAAGAVRGITRGWVGLPVLAPWTAVIEADGPARPLGRIVVIERDDSATGLRWLDGLEPVAARIAAVLDRDLRVIAAHNAAWADEAARTRGRVLDIARRSIAASGATCAVLIVPGRWPATYAIEAVEHEVGLGT